MAAVGGERRSLSTLVAVVPPGFRPTGLFAWLSFTGNPGDFYHSLGVLARPTRRVPLFVVEREGASHVLETLHPCLTLSVQGGRHIRMPIAVANFKAVKRSRQPYPAMHVSKILVS